MLTATKFTIHVALTACRCSTTACTAADCNHVNFVHLLCYCILSIPEQAEECGAERALRDSLFEEVVDLLPLRHHLVELDELVRIQRVLVVLVWSLVRVRSLQHVSNISFSFSIVGISSQDLAQNFQQEICHYRSSITET